MADHASDDWLPPATLEEAIEELHDLRRKYRPIVGILSALASTMGALSIPSCEIDRPGRRLIFRSEGDRVLVVCREEQELHHA